MGNVGRSGSIDDADRQHEITPPPDLLDRIFAQWPDMARYRDTATVERVDYWLRGERRWCWFVTITA